MYVNSAGKSLDPAYSSYFRKKSGARVVRARGSRLVSKILDVDPAQSDRPFPPYGFCLNDPRSSLAAIRSEESGFVILDEGLIATYPTDSVLRHFRAVYGKVIDSDLRNAVFPGTPDRLADFSVLSDPGEKVSPFVMVCFPCRAGDASRLIGTFTDEFVKYGYYMSSYEVESVQGFDIAYVQFEAKYTNMLAELEDTLYHVTPLKNLKRVLKNGLVPYDKARQFEYPPRVYLFNRCPSETIYEYAMHKAAETGDSGFCVFRVQRDALLADQIFAGGEQKFYLDPAFSLSDSGTDQTAVFTYQDIPLRCVDDSFVMGKYADGELKTSVESVEKSGGARR